MFSAILPCLPLSISSGNAVQELSKALLMIVIMRGRVHTTHESHDDKLVYIHFHAKQ